MNFGDIVNLGAHPTLILREAAIGQEVLDSLGISPFLDQKQTSGGTIANTNLQRWLKPNIKGDYTLEEDHVPPYTPPWWTDHTNPGQPCLGKIIQAAVKVTLRETTSPLKGQG